MMSEVEAARRLDWQNRVYEMHLNGKQSTSINFAGRKILVSRDVFAPVPFDHNLLAKSVLKEVKETDRVLDMGTGSGVQAILAASKSTSVTAVDVNPFAVKLSERNVKLNKLCSQVKASKAICLGMFMESLT